MRHYGHLDDKVPANLRGVTGVLLTNIFEGSPADIKHPRLIERYLHSGMPRSDQYVAYRSAVFFGSSIASVSAAAAQPVAIDEIH
jgi:hypothetical protein